MDDDITRHRAAIDALDEKIVALLNERANHAAAIGKLYQAHRARPRFSSNRMWLISEPGTVTPSRRSSSS